jgi:hypothetical protein
VNDLHFGVVVGIDRYPGIPGIEPLSHARTDAARFHSWLVSPQGGAVPKENVELMQDPTVLPKLRGAYPTQRDVNDVLAKWRARVTVQAPPGGQGWQNTRLYVYVAGHGYAPADGKAALLMADAAEDQLGYHIEIQKYVDWLTVCAPFREVLVFSYGPPFSTCKHPHTVEVFAVIGYATREGGEALEPRNPGNADDARGVFTGAVLDGLNGAAADGGVVTSASLATYVRSSVEERTATAPVRQRVEFPADLTQQIIICDAGPGPSRKVTINFPAGAHGRAEIRGGPKVIASHEIDGNSWTLQLPDALYELVPGDGAGGFAPKPIKVAEAEVNVDA